MLKVPINAKMSFNREKLPSDPPQKKQQQPRPKVVTLAKNE
jgi:hypothetical protein